MNALTPHGLLELRSALTDSERSEDVAVVVLKGAGGKAFCSGADIHVFEELRDRADAEKFWRKTALETHTFIESMTKPVIAMVTGYCLGGGLEIALCCDYVLATPDSKLGFPEINLGLIPGWGGTQRIARLVGRQKAKELVMLGEMIDANQAEKLGIVNKVVAREKIDDEVRKLVESLSSKSRQALASAKNALNTAYETDLSKGLSHETDLDLILLETSDTKSRISSFLNRRRSKKT